MAYRVRDGVKTLEVHSDSIVKARVTAIKALDQYPIGWQFAILNGLTGPEHKTKAGIVTKGENGTFLWASLKNNKYDREYVLYKNGTLGRRVA